MENRDTLRGRTHLRAHPRHRPPALARDQGRRRRRSRGRRRRDPPGRPRRRAHGEGRDPVGDRQPDRRTARLASISTRTVGVAATRSLDGRRASRARRGEQPRPCVTAAPFCMRCRPASRSTPKRDIVDPRGMIGETPRRRSACRHRRGRGGAQPHARGRALPSRHRGGDRDALCGRPCRRSSTTRPRWARRRRHGRRHDERRRLRRRPPRPRRRDRGRRPPCHHGHRARASRPASPHAERLKTLYGSSIASSSDDRDMIAVPQVDEDERDVPNHRAEVAARADHPAARRGDPRARARPAQECGLRGSSRTAGRADRRRQPADRACPRLPRRILQGQVRVGRPLGIKGLPEAAKGPAFSAAVGLLVYPQVAHDRAFRAALERLVAGHRNRRLHARGWADGFADSF